MSSGLKAVKTVSQNMLHDSMAARACILSVDC